ncbi:MAG TPA: OB-fold nucleic acid binding domain-containing protein, partial [Planctomycetota bacterium]|nr:OB-fold nucleic acid binding domain-containing protein [Planctomycetota bacterium]
FAAEGGAIRIGLDSVAGLSSGAIDSILAARPFSSLQDFLRRADVSLPEAKSLVLAGALDFLGRSRPELLLEATATRGRARPGSLRIPRIPDFGEREKRAREFEVLDMSPGIHLMELLSPGLDRAGMVSSAELEALVGRRIRVVGVLDALRVEETRSGGSMEFLTLEDEAGVFEVTVFPQVYRRFASSVRGYGPFVVTGRVDDQHGAIAVNAERIEKAPERAHSAQLSASEAHS